MAKLFKKRQDLPDLRQTVEALKDAPVMTMYGDRAGRGKAKQLRGSTVTPFPRP